TTRGKSASSEAAAASAAALLTAAGGGPLSSGGPGTSSGVRLVKNSVGMTFVRIQPGTFMMGSPEGEVGRREHESPLHEVRLTRTFYMSVVPVTQAQYEAVKSKNPSKF